MSVSITNASLMPFTVSLYHDSYCAVSGRCECKRVAAQSPLPGAEGGVVFQHQTRRVPKTLSVEPGGTVGGLPDAILKVPQVMRARKGNPPRISVVTSPTAAAAPAPQVKAESPPKNTPSTEAASPSAQADVTAPTPDSDAGESRSRRRHPSSSSQARS